MARRGDEARSALVEAAERLFAERGIEGVSLRDVSAAAGQRNHSAAQYHFGDRAGLVAAVYENRMAAVNVRRLELLAAADRLDGDLHRDALIEAVVVPLVEAVTGTDGWYGRFLARVRWDPVAADLVAGLQSAEGFALAVEGLRPHLHDLPSSLRRNRIEQVLTLLTGTLAGWEWAQHRGERRLTAAALQAELIATSLAVLQAPASVASNRSQTNSAPVPAG